MIVKKGKIEQVIRDEKDQYELIFNQVRLTFLYYPYHISFSKKISDLKMPELLALAAMKAYALGRRAKWKDYVDLYFIMKDHHSMTEITNAAKIIYGHKFSEKFSVYSLPIMWTSTFQKKWFFTRVCRKRQNHKLHFEV